MMIPRVAVIALLSALPGSAGLLGAQQSSSGASWSAVEEALGRSGVAKQ